MATTDPVQQISEEISTVQSRIKDLQEHVRLTDTQGEVGDLNTTLNGPLQRLATARTHGYVFGKDLENQAQPLVSSGAQLYPSLQSQINTQSTDLVNSLGAIEIQLPQLTAAAGNPAAARSLLGTIQAMTAMLEEKVSAAEKYIISLYEQLGDQVSRFLRTAGPDRIPDRSTGGSRLPAPAY